MNQRIICPNSFYALCLKVIIFISFYLCNSIDCLDAKIGNTQEVDLFSEVALCSSKVEKDISIRVEIDEIGLFLMHNLTEEMDRIDKDNRNEAEEKELITDQYHNSRD